MLTTYTLVLRKELKSGLCPVHLRITAQRLSKQVATGVEIPAAHWNAKGSLRLQNWVRAANPDADVFNAHLAKLARTAQELAFDDVARSAEQTRDEVARRHALGVAGRGGLTPRLGEGAGPAPDGAAPEFEFLDYFAREVKRRDQSGHPRTVEKFALILHKMRHYLAGPEAAGLPALERDRLLAAQRLPLAAFTGRWLRDYAEWLGQRGNKDSTIAKELSFIKTITRQATEDGLLPEELSPFRRYKLVGKNAAAPKVRLSADQVRALELLVVPPPEALARRRYSAAQVARATWLLQYYLFGSRVGDVLTLRWGQVQADAVRFTEHKTGKSKEVPRLPALDAVLRQLAAWGERQPPGPLDFVVPLLDAAAPYAQYDPRQEWSLLQRLPATRPTYRLLLRKIESVTSTLNEGLKEVQALLQLDGDRLSTHSARHTFANAGRVKGVAAAHMRDLLNHHSVAQTEVYFGELKKGEQGELARQIYG